MTLHVSNRVLMRVAAVALLPVSAYNLVVGIGAAVDGKVSNDFMRSLSGGIVSLVASLGFVWASCSRPERKIAVC